MRQHDALSSDPLTCALLIVGDGDDTVGNPRQAQIAQFEMFKLIFLFRLNNQIPVERLEATVSQSTVPSPLLNSCCVVW